MIKKLQDLKWRPPAEWVKISSVDMHAGGEPLRILIHGIPEVKGRTILEKRKYFKDHLDHIRKGIILEPRGHSDMYGAVITEPCTDDGDLGVLFLHNEGYSTMCGHAIIALTKFVLDTRVIRTRAVTHTLQIDAPPGRIVSTGFRKGGVVSSVSFRNVPSFVLTRDQHVEVPGLGRIRYDVAFGGAFYAIVEADRLGLSLDTREYDRLVDLGRRIKKSVITNQKITHPFENELSYLYGVIFTGKPFNPSRHSRNVCVFAKGEVDRSATGTGVSARAALHYARGDLKMGDRMTIESIVGSAMEVELAGLTTYGPHKAIIPVVSGTASFTGRHQFWFDPEDPFRDGFFMR